jgi:hypothetical protein
MSFESGLQTKVIKYLRNVGAMVDNIHGNEYQASIADLIICYRGRYIALELKAPDGVLSSGQRHKLRKVQRAGGIGECIHGINKVQSIIDTIDRGEVWCNSDY